MGKVILTIVILLISVGLFLILATDTVADKWLGYIESHTKEHDWVKDKDPWVMEQKFKVARYCQKLGNSVRAFRIYTELLEKYPNTYVAFQSDYYIGQCFEGLMDFNNAREHYRNCYEAYPDYANDDIAFKAKQRFNEIIANRI